MDQKWKEAEKDLRTRESVSLKKMQVSRKCNKLLLSLEDYYSLDALE